MSEKTREDEDAVRPELAPLLSKKRAAAALEADAKGRCAYVCMQMVAGIE